MSTCTENSLLRHDLHQNFTDDRAEVGKAYGDYFEEEKTPWEEVIMGEGELRVYFVLRITAAGWHSAVLVLVDEEKADQMRRKQAVSPPQGGKLIVTTPIAYGTYIAF